MEKVDTIQEQVGGSAIKEMSIREGAKVQGANPCPP